MAHPDGGGGNTFATHHTFEQARQMVGNGFDFLSSTHRPTRARVGMTQDGARPTIAFAMEDAHGGGNVCQSCWGFRISCSGTRIGQWVEALDQALP